MLTKPLYETDSYARECEATVLSCTPVENAFHVILDQTVFFPEGGGQPGDRGFLNDIPVLDTQEISGEIVHICASPFESGETVTGKIDFDRRLDMMRQHTGEHILSYACWHLFDAVNVGFHLNEEFATFDLDKVLAYEQIAEAETFANHQVMENLPIRCYYKPKKELDMKKVRKVSAKAGEHPRLVEMVGGDICSCCGTPTAFTGEVGPIAVTGVEKHRGGVRITFLCGNRALPVMQQNARIMKELTATLSTNKEKIHESVVGLQENLIAARRELNETASALLALQAKELLANSGDSPFVLACMENGTPQKAKVLLNLLIEAPKMAVVVYTKGEQLFYMCSSHKQAPALCKTACELLNGLFAGKGGGKDSFAQGGGKATSGWQTLCESILPILKANS